MVAAADEMAMEQLAMSFDDVVRGTQSVRWHLLKLINEYARHNGHATSRGSGLTA